MRNGEFADVIGGESLEEGGSFSSCDSYTPHVADIEDPDMRTDSMALVHDTAVLDRHLPSGEIDKFGPAGVMVREQWRTLHDDSQAKEFNVEDQRRVWRNHTASALSAITEL